MLHAIMGLLFLPEFTVSIHAYKGYGEERRSATRSGQSTTSGSLVFPSLLWHSGVGYPDASVVNSSNYDKNRKEVLALLLTCFSSILYQTAETCSNWKDRFLEVATATDCPFTPTLFYSLLNIVVSYDPVGWGVPYAGSIVSDDRELLVDLSLQVLLVLLDFGQTTETTRPRRQAAAWQLDPRSEASLVVRDVENLEPHFRRCGECVPQLAVVAPETGGLPVDFHGVVAPIEQLPPVDEHAAAQLDQADQVPPGASRSAVEDAGREHGVLALRAEEGGR